MSVSPKETLSPFASRQESEAAIGPWSLAYLYPLDPGCQYPDWTRLLADHPTWRFRLPANPTVKRSLPIGQAGGFGQAVADSGLLFNLSLPGGRSNPQTHQRILVSSA